MLLKETRLQAVAKSPADASKCVEVAVVRMKIDVATALPNGIAINTYMHVSLTSPLSTAVTNVFEKCVC